MRQILLMTIALAVLGAGIVTGVTAVQASGLGEGTSLEQALRSAAESGHSVYAGDCSHTRSPQDIGKTCTKLVEERGAVRAYLVGQTFSEFRHWIFLEQGPYGWEVVGSVGFDSHGSPNAIPWPPEARPPR
jgi:hypothetical protein